MTKCMWVQRYSVALGNKHACVFKKATMYSEKNGVQ